MALKLMKYGDGYRPNWYGAYRKDGKVKTENLHVPIGGRPPASGDLHDKGDRGFERSRTAAQAVLDELEAKAKSDNLEVRKAEKERGDGIEQLRKIYKAKTGGDVCDPDLHSLADRRMNDMGGNHSDGHRSIIRTAFNSFADFAAAPGAGLKPAQTMLAVSSDHAEAFFKMISSGDRPYSFSTLKKFAHLLSGEYARHFPGMENPFKDIIKRCGIGKAKKGANGEKERAEKVIHHRPLDREQLRKLFDAAKVDQHADILYPLAVTAASTGARISDCCMLKWKDVDLDAGCIAGEAIKSGVNFAVPIFDYDPDSENYDELLGAFRKVLEKALTESKKGDRYVFPEAARMYLRTETSEKSGEEYQQGASLIYTWGKELFARALFAEEPTEVKPISKNEDERPSIDSVRAAIKDAEWDDVRKRRAVDICGRYLAGKSYRKIEADTGYSKSTIAYDLGSIERLMKKKLKIERRNVDASMKQLLAYTRKGRTAGKRAASLYSWHSLRCSFVVMMYDNGVPLDMIKMLVGHTTTEMTMEYYNPTRKIAAEAAKKIIGHRNRLNSPRTALASQRGVTIHAQGSNAAGGGFDALCASLANLTPAQKRQISALLK